MQPQHTDMLLEVSRFWANLKDVGDVHDAAVDVCDIGLVLHRSLLVAMVGLELLGETARHVSWLLHAQASECRAQNRFKEEEAAAKRGHVRCRG
jgi:hypothetical protein